MLGMGGAGELKSEMQEEDARPGTSEARTMRPAVTQGAEMSARATLGILSAVAILSVAVRVALGAIVPAPFVFLDELGYEQLARSFAATGHFALYGKSGLSYSPLYPILLSPIYALTSSASTAFAGAKIVNAVLMSLSVFPIYGISRFILPRRPSLLVGALGAIAPLMAYSSVELSENLAYPLCLAAIWAMLIAIHRPSDRADLVLLAAIVVAALARLQLVVLVPAALAAIVVVALFEPAAGRRRKHIVAKTIAHHRVFAGTVGAILVAAVARTAINGGALPLAGRYSSIGHARPNLAHVLRIFVDHVAGLDLATGVLPFACALLMAYALAQAGFQRVGLAFAAVAVSVTTCLLIEVALDAAAYDTGKVRLSNGQIRGDAPRFHERYLIYVIPFFLVALVVAIQLRRRVPRRVHLLIAGCSAALPAIIPYHKYINEALVADSPALQFLANVRKAHLVAISHATVTAFVFAAVLSAVYLLAFMGRHRPLALVVLVAVLLVSSAAYAGRIRSAGRGSLTLNLSSHNGTWVDSAVAHDVTLVSGKGVTRVALLETAFFNLSITRLYYVCWSGFEPGFGEQPLVVGADGRLRDATGPLKVSYAVVPTRLNVPGRVVARDKRGRLELVQPTNGFLTVPRQARSDLGCG
jgi:hypothetical protein